MADMNWISVKKKLPKDGEKVIIWQHNITDKKSSRHHCAVMLKMKDGDSFFDIYPKVFRKTFHSKNKFTEYDLEGDTCKITHWMPLPSPPKK